jgi:putative MATE family efflux protein
MSDHTLATPTAAAPSSSPRPTAPPAVAARTRLLLDGAIVPTLFKLAAPNVLTLLAFTGMITFDGFFLGRIGTSALAGASLAFPWVMLILQATNSGMGVGVASAVARALGAGRRDRADDLAHHALVLALALAAIFSTAMLLGAPFLFRWMGGRADMLADALAYANVALGGAVAICVLNLLGNAVRGTGNMSLPAAVLVGCVVAHIAISPLLIFGLGPLPALGPAGAGWGLVLPFGVGSLVMIGYLRSSRAIVRLRFRGVALRRELFVDILKVGLPGLGNIAITNLSVALLTGIAGQLGPETAIGYAMGARLEYILQPIAFGFGSALVAMVGTNWGARQYGRARRIAWTGAATVALLCGTIGVTVAVHPALWIDVFSDDAEVARIGALYLRIVGPAYLCFGLGLGLFYVTQGLGRGVAAMSANGVRMIAGAAGGLVAVYALDLGVRGFFAAVGVAFCLYAALLVRAVTGVKAPAIVAAALLAGGLVFGGGGAQAAGQLACWPALAFQDVRFSEMTPPRQERRWTARLAVDASRCATVSGRFAVVFERAKENGLDVEFQEQFEWRPGAVEIAVDFWSDEAVARYWLNNVEPCLCRR